MHAALLILAFVGVYVLNAHELGVFFIIYISIILGYIASLYTKYRTPFSLVILLIITYCLIVYFRQRQFPDAEFQSIVSLLVSLVFYVFLLGLFFLATQGMRRRI